MQLLLERNDRPRKLFSKFVANQTEGVGWKKIGTSRGIF